MADTCPTVDIVSDHPEHGGFIRINKSDFDPLKHKFYVPPVPKTPISLPPPPTL